MEHMVRAVVLPSPPELNPCILTGTWRRKPCELGPDGAFFMTLAAAINISVIFVVATDIDTSENSSAVGLLDRGLADIAAQTAALTYTRYNRAGRVSNPILQSEIAYIVNAAYKSEISWMLIKPFSTRFWVVTFSVYVSVWITKRVFRMYTQAQKPGTLFGTGGIVATIIFGIYSSILTIEMYQPEKLDMPFKTFDELANALESHRMKIVTHDVSYIYTYFSQPNEQLFDYYPVLKKLQRAVASGNIPLPYKDADNALETVNANPSYVMAVSGYRAPWYLARHCGLVTVPDIKTPGDDQLMVLYMNRHFRLNFPLDTSVGSLYKHVLSKHTFEQQINKRCEESEQEHFRELKIRDLADAYILMVIVCLFAIACFLLEVLSSRAYHCHGIQMLSLKCRTVIELIPRNIINH